MAAKRQVTWKCPECKKTQPRGCTLHTCEYCGYVRRICYDYCSHYKDDPEDCLSCALVKEYDSIAQWIITLINNNSGRPIPMEVLRDNVDWEVGQNLQAAVLHAINDGVLHWADRGDGIAIGPHPVYGIPAEWS